eukprot:TRINITY_DN26627_c0_g2_i1.p1 TRINITY_DN26627_c0_g2~~TRINITY_DN26627_c0_g2_i1.p1  ORF type:complete len:651 (+),score=115.85 TRINITY_DN26627_c0_g2_i1:148-1953(+)
MATQTPVVGENDPSKLQIVEPPKEVASNIPKEVDANDPDLLFKPIRVGRSYFEVRKSGLKVTTKAHLLATSYSHTLMWDTIKKCELESGCFKATLTLRTLNGKDVAISGWAYKMQEVAQIIYSQMAGDKSSELDPEVMKNIGWRSKVQLLSNGIIVKKPTFCCQGVATFVPWGAVVFAQRRKGVLYDSITIRTLAREEDMASLACKTKAGQNSKLQQATKVQPKSSKADPKADPAKKPLADNKKKGKVEHEGGAHYVEATLRIRSSHGDDVFNLVTKLMRCGKSDEVLPNAPQTKKTIVTSAGVETESFFYKTFVPWRSVTSVDFADPLIGKGKVILTDRVGTVVKLKGFTRDMYDSLKNIYGTTSELALQDRGLDGQKPAIIRKRVRISTDGVEVEKRKCLCLESSFHFYPWSEIDGAEMFANCFGGSVHLVTESGEIILAYHSYFASKKVIEEVLIRLREMKYRNHGTEQAVAAEALVFGGKLGSSRACALTDVSLRLVAKRGLCRSMVCLLDLDSVHNVQTVSKSGMLGKTHYLLVWIDKKMGVSMQIDDYMKKQAKFDKVKADDQVIVVKLRSTDNGAKIKSEILRRTNARKKDEMR